MPCYAMENLVRSRPPTVDATDLRLLSVMVKDVRSPFKKMSESLKLDERTVAKRVQRMAAERIFFATLEIDWQRIGVAAPAYLGCKTAQGIENREAFLNFVKNDPRVVEAYTTVGSNEYMLKILGTDLQELRNDILYPLEPLTTDLNTSVVSSFIKRRDPAPFLSLLTESKKP